MKTPAARFGIAAFAAMLVPAAGVLGGDLHVPGDYATIQAAINAAVNDDHIIVAPGTYSEALDLKGKRLTLRSSDGADQTVLDGAGLAQTIIYAGSGETLDTVVEGFTLTNGQGGPFPNCVNGQGPAGGAAYISGSALTFRDCAFVHNGYNIDIKMGGAIMVYDDGSLTAERCLFQDNGGTLSENDLVAAFGGAIAACRSAAGSVLLTECTFIGNQASHGGGVISQASGEFDVRGSTFTGNQASFGGGINVVISNNEFGTPSLAVVDGCTFLDNLSGFGGGVFCMANVDTGYPLEPAPELWLINSRFAGNEARDCCNTGIFQNACWKDGLTEGTYFGGGADLREQDGGVIKVGNCIFSGNAGTSAAGLHVATCGEPDFGFPGGTIEVANTDFLNNDGIGLVMRVGRSGVITASNLIARGQAEGEQVTIEIKDPFEEEAFAEVRYSNVEGGFEGDGNIDAPPKFVDPASGDFRLAAGSPGIDAGDNGDITSWLATDFSGADRFVDDPASADSGLGTPPLVDMGAFEFQAACYADFTGDGSLDLFDFLAYVNAFNAGSAGADCDGDGDLTLFDFLCFVNAFNQGC